VKAPFSWPNNSDATRSRGTAAQFTLTKVREARSDLRCMARAISSLPVPVSPVMRTVESLGATLEMRERTPFKAGEVPTISSIENNNVRNFKDLRGMRRNAKSLKRNDGHAKEFLLLPQSSLAFLL
jgi:hypothetical protein